MDRTVIKKWLLYALFSVGLLLLREFLIVRFKFLGVYPVLDGLLVAIIAMFEGGVAGAVTGLIIGILKDSSNIVAEGYFAVMYLLCGGAVGVVCSFLFRKKFITSLLWSMAVTAATTLVLLIFFFIMGRADISALWMVAIPEIIYSSVFVPLVYYPIRSIYKMSGGTDVY